MKCAALTKHRNLATDNSDIDKQGGQVSAGRLGFGIFSGEHVVFCSAWLCEIVVKIFSDSYVFSLGLRLA